MESTEFKFPTEIIDLPSKGWFHPVEHPLASGQIELYYMTAKHEDILTSKNLIQRGVVIDKLLEALIATNVPLSEDLLGDKAAIMIASRILGYGKDYDVSLTCPECEAKNQVVINLEDIEPKTSPYFVEEFKNRNEFPFYLPLTKKNITFKFLNHGDEMQIRSELDGIKKATRSDIDREVTTRLRKIITSVEGEKNADKIRIFVDSLPARDARVLREHLKDVTPDVDVSTNFTCSHCGYEGRVDIPIDVNFFWPNTRV